jgi:hypothetical protein
LALSESLVSDTTYTLRWSDGCSGGTRTFTTTASVALPISAGTVSVGDLKSAPPYCIGGKPASPTHREVYFAEDPSVVPFLPFAKVDVLVDGKFDGYAGKPFGHYKETDATVGNVQQACPAAPRTIRIAVQVKIAGGPTLITPEITTELRCLEEYPGGCPDTGVVDPDPVEDSGIDPTDPDDAQIPTPPDDAGAAATPNRDDVVVGGCTCDTPRAASTAPWLALIGLPLLVARRTKRGRRSPSSGD